MRYSPRVRGIRDHSHPGDVMMVIKLKKVLHNEGHILGFDIDDPTLVEKGPNVKLISPGL